MKETEAEITLSLAARLFILVPGAKMDAMASACPAARLKGRRIWITGCFLRDRITVSRQTTIRQRESMIWFLPQMHAGNVLRLTFFTFLLLFLFLLLYFLDSTNK